MKTANQAWFQETSIYYRNLIFTTFRKDRIFITPLFTNKGRHKSWSVQLSQRVRIWSCVLQPCPHPVAPSHCVPVLRSGGFLVSFVKWTMGGMDPTFSSSTSASYYTSREEYWMQNRVEKLIWDLLGWSKDICWKGLGFLACLWGLTPLVLASWLEDQAACKSSDPVSGMLL